MIRLLPSSERTPAVRILLALLFVGVFAPAFFLLSGWAMSRAEVHALPGQESPEPLGVAWMERDLEIERLVVRAVADGKIYATEDHFLYVSHDEGRTFQQRGVLPKADPTLGVRSRNLIARHPLIRLYRDQRGPESIAVLESGTILVFYDRIYRSTDGGWTFEIVPVPAGAFHSPFPHGVAVDEHDRVYFGEYRAGARPQAIRVFRGSDDGRAWEVCHAFEPGEVFHVHSVRHDPFSGRMLVATGDRDEESWVFWLDSGCGGVEPLGGGSQDWRVIAPIFTDEAVVWGTDNDRTGASIVAWDRRTGNLEHRHVLGKPAYYGTRLYDGTFVVSVTYEPESDFTRSNGPRAVAKLWVSRDGTEWEILDEFAWKREKLPWGVSRAIALIPTDDGSVPYLFVSPLGTEDGFVTYRYRVKGR